MWTSIDACVVYPETGKAYFFSGHEYLRYDIAADRADDGYPQRIADHWPGLTGPVRAAIRTPDGRVCFFLSDYGCVWYDVVRDRVDPEVRSVATCWRGLLDGGLHHLGGMTVWPDGKAYFFGQLPLAAQHPGEAPPLVGTPGYVRYDLAGGRADRGYPRPVADPTRPPEEQPWPGLGGEPGQQVDAVAVWPDGKAYFFSGSTYVRYDVATDRVDPGYPWAISEDWPGLPVGEPELAY